MSLITLGVADLARARAFYEEGLGWTRGNSDDSVAFYQMPGAILALWSRAALAEDIGRRDSGTSSGTSFGGVALAYNTRSREDVDRVLAEAAAAGANLLKPGNDTFWGGYSGYFADPDGHVWEVAFNPHWELDAEGRTRLPS